MTTSTGASEVIGKHRRRLGGEDLLYHIEGALRFGHAYTIVLHGNPDGTIGDPKFTVDTREDKRKIQPFG